MASYPTSSKVFPTQVDQGYILDTDINNIQAEITAIEDQLITSKLASLSSAPTANKVLTSVDGVLTWVALDWTAWTVTVTSASGTITTKSAAGQYLKIGKLVVFHAQIAITTKGTAAGYASMNLPIEASFQFCASPNGQVITTATGDFISALQCSIFPATALKIYEYDGTTPFTADGQTFVISGFYPIA